jgi:cytochrome c oxidase assembly protein subunit 11
MTAGPSVSRHRRAVVLSIASAAGMLGLTYAAVPLYAKFCRVTGYAGTTQRAAKAPDKALDQVISVRFDANTAGSLDWNFRPAQTAIKVKIGEQYLAHYKATNLSNHTITGTAIFNVTPDGVGAYFDKIQCFCFTEQTLKPGETADLPVTFFVDPAIVDDPNTRSISEITLSYTFYPVDRPKAVSSAEATGAQATN